jgi:hypothetical protein
LRDLKASNNNDRSSSHHHQKRYEQLEFENEDLKLKNHKYTIIALEISQIFSALIGENYIKDKDDGAERFRLISNKVEVAFI